MVPGWICANLQLAPFKQLPLAYQLHGGRCGHVHLSPLEQEFFLANSIQKRCFGPVLGARPVRPALPLAEGLR